MEAALCSKSDRTYFKRLIYLAYMIQLYRLSMAELNHKQCNDKSFSGASYIVINYLTTLFCDESQRGNGNLRFFRTKYSLRMSAKSKDRLLGYIIAFCLNLNSFNLDTMALSTDLGITGTKLNSVAKELGCRVETSRKSGVISKKIVLALPLVFPLMTRGSRK